MSWTINQAWGHGQVPAEDRRAVARYDALPSRPGELWFLSACAHAALAGLADQAGSGVSAAEAASEAETAVTRLHQHAAWFYRQLALISEWQSGYQDYANASTQASATKHIRVPVQSSYVEAGYLLTGETRSSVGIVKPKNPFTLRRGESGLGAWEVFGRYDYLDIGSSVYSYGLASTTGNANRLWMTDTGITWHMTQYVKMFFDWNHVEFNNPVTYNTGKYQTTSNTFWWRLQLFF